MINLFLGTLAIALSLGLVSQVNGSFSSTASSVFSDSTATEVKEYYSSLQDGIKGEELLTSLQTLLKENQKPLQIDEVASGNWNLFVLLDRDFEKDPLSESEILTNTWKTDNVICSPLYDETFTFVKANSPGNKINREHVLPKSYGFQDKNSYAPYAGTDMHNLHMGEAKNNQQGHNNYPYGNVVDKSTATKIVSTISGNVTGYLGNNKNKIPVYEPLDKDKGDIARSIFYMAARYHTYDGTVSNSPGIKLVDDPDPNIVGTSIYAIETKDNPVGYGVLSDLLSWNVLDPVDNHEIHRNNLVYNAVQYNRNPFIDYPSWATIAFKDSLLGIDKSQEPNLIGSINPPEEEKTKQETPKASYNETKLLFTNLDKEIQYQFSFSDTTTLIVTSSSVGTYSLKDNFENFKNKTIIGLTKLGDGNSLLDSDPQTFSIFIASDANLIKEETPHVSYSNYKFNNLEENSTYRFVFSDKTTYDIDTKSDKTINALEHKTTFFGKTIVGIIKLGDGVTTKNSDAQTVNISIIEESTEETPAILQPYMIYALILIGVVVIATPIVIIVVKKNSKKKKK